MADKFYDPQMECADRETMHALQSRRLVTMVEHCYSHVPLYKKRFDEMGLQPGDIRSIDDVAKLPFTYKTDLRDNYPFGLIAVPFDDLIRVHASSGTTGKQTVVGYTRNDIDVWAQGCARALVAAGGSKADFVHVSYGYGLFTGGLGLHYGAEKLGATAIPVSVGNTARQVTILQDYGSDILCCTPSYAMYIGETVRDMGIDPKTLKLRAGVFGAEAWTDRMRREIEAILDIKAYDIYGLSEIAGPGVAYECCEQTGMHVCEDFFYPEIIDPDTGKPLPDGEYGELVFTCIGKEALPLLRYRTRDICKISRQKCACGRTLVKMSKTRGRTDDMLIIRGINVFPSQVEHVLLSLGMAPNYLIVVDRKNNLDSMEIQVEMTPEMFSDTVKHLESIERKIAEAMHSTLNISAKIRLVEPKSLPRSQGKAIRVIDNRNP
ncbi:MAG TPA: phenylacetate--CoA ligase [Candidatus Scatavimonas merdigallinarum]|uniref:Phenylacetate-coenzyme A ligase n=1 Tax=Candidatus Scatavimonas merdigallinarum TaxID=2840914 RepID=A0A9D1CVT7_9FIRM|nr:phenylacetate--CoA ligase [Candidatus Scatavimonas merdigallinarum]